MKTFRVVFLVFLFLLIWPVTEAVMAVSTQVNPPDVFECNGVEFQSSAWKPLQIWGGYKWDNKDEWVACDSRVYVRYHEDQTWEKAPLWVWNIHYLSSYNKPLPIWIWKEILTMPFHPD